ncbi:MAG: hypothetical protein AAF721_22765 [Myxococcota bacterium]
MKPFGIAVVTTALALALGGCKEDGPPAPQYTEEGDPCHTDFGKRCVDDGQVFHCVERAWTVSSCGELCVARGPAFVGGACVVGEYVEDCECALADPEGCMPGELRCTDSETIGECDDSQQWVEYACAELCEEGQPSLGCSEEPTACVCGL